MMEIDFVRSRFIKHFDGKTGNVYASPGRINLIGEHTDYNGGFVFPGAVDKGVMAEMRANGTEDTVMAYAIDLKDRVDFKLSDPAGPRASWARYIYGIALEMKKLGVPVKSSARTRFLSGIWYWLVRLLSTTIAVSTAVSWTSLHPSSERQAV